MSGCVRINIEQLDGLQVIPEDIFEYNGSFFGINSKNNVPLNFIQYILISHQNAITSFFEFFGRRKISFNLFN